MRFPIMLVVLMFTAAPVLADSLVSEPHALVYYQLPFSGSAQETRARFGLRLDRTVHEAGAPVEFRSLMGRPAVMDLRFGNAGMESFSFAGVDYLARYRALNADAEQAPAEQAPTEQAPAESGTQKPADKPATEEDKLTMGKILDEAPMGYIIGAGIGLLLLGTSAAD